MIVAVSTRTNEASLSGSPRDYRELAVALQRGHGSIALDAGADVSPYDLAMERLNVDSTDSGGVTIAVHLEANALTITGARDKLAILADILLDSASPPEPGGHVHIEYFDDHAYLDPASLPLVINDAQE